MCSIMKVRKSYLPAICCFLLCLAIILGLSSAISGQIFDSGSAEEELEISIFENSFQTDCPIIRAERPFKLLALIIVDSLVNYECRLIVPANCLVSGNKRTPAKEGTMESWDVVCHNPGQVDFTIELLVA